MTQARTSYLSRCQTSVEQEHGKSTLSYRLTLLGSRSRGGQNQNPQCHNLALLCFWFKYRSHVFAPSSLASQRVKHRVPQVPSLKPSSGKEGTCTNLNG